MSNTAFRAQTSENRNDKKLWFYFTVRQWENKNLFFDAENQLYPPDSAVVISNDRIGILVQNDVAYHSSFIGACIRNKNTPVLVSSVGIFQAFVAGIIITD